MSTDDSTDAIEAARLAQISDRGRTLLPPSSIDRAAAAGRTWAESLVEERIGKLPIEAWPRWPSFQNASARGRAHAEQLVEPLLVEIARRDRRAYEAARLARQRHARELLVELCYLAAAARYAELAAWRLT